MREIKTKPVAPIYAFLTVWVFWCLFLPMYRLWHFIFLILLSSSVRFIFSKIFRTKITYVPIPEPEPEPEPSPPMDPEAEKLIKEGELAVAEMTRLMEAIKSDSVKRKVGEIIEVSAKIIKNVSYDPSDIPQVKRFLNYYLPTTIKMLNAYDRMYDQGIDGKNITGSMERIDAMLDSVIVAYNKQLDSLFASEALDIETDIQVLEGFLAREGLKDSDFKSKKERNS